MMKKNIFRLFLIFTGISSQFYGQNIRQIYNDLNDTSLNYEAFYQTVKAVNIICPPNDSIIAIADYTKPSSQKRFYIINIKSRKILIKTYVAHGKYSGENYAVRFTNKPHTGGSSPGFYLTKDTYTGKHGYSLRLEGLEKGINDNAMKRAIVVHGAWYVTENFIKQYGRLGRSQGCFAVKENEAKKIIDIIKGGAVLYAYTKDKNYTEKSQFLKRIK